MCHEVAMLHLTASVWGAGGCPCETNKHRLLPRQTRPPCNAVWRGWEKAVPRLRRCEPATGTTRTMATQLQWWTIPRWMHKSWKQWCVHCTSNREEWGRSGCRFGRTKTRSPAILGKQCSAYRSGMLWGEQPCSSTAARVRVSRSTCTIASTTRLHFQRRWSEKPAATESRLARREISEGSCHAPRPGEGGMASKAACWLGVRRFLPQKWLA